MIGEKVRILKDDGCNTNIISSDFVNKHRSKLDVRRYNLTIHNSNKATQEEATEIVWDTEIKIGNTAYRSNWAVAQTRYDVLLGMPWHKENNPNINYSTKEVLVDGIQLPRDPTEEEARVEVTNIGVKKFRSILRKKKSNAEVFIVQNINTESHNNRSKESQETACPKHSRILQKFHKIFVEDLPDGLPPKRAVDHEIKLKEDTIPPRRPSFQLSPAELKATKEYITKHLKSGKLRPSKSPYGAPLFFVRQKGELRGVIDYRALNLITKKNNAPFQG